LNLRSPPIKSLQRLPWFYSKETLWRKMYTLSFFIMRIKLLKYVSENFIYFTENQLSILNEYPNSSTSWSISSEISSYSTPPLFLIFFIISIPAPTVLSKFYVATFLCNSCLLILQHLTLLQHTIFEVSN